MGKGKRNKSNKRKDSKKPVCNKGTKVGCSASNASKAMIGGKKVTKSSQESTGEFHAAGNFPQRGTKEMEVGKRSTEDVNVADETFLKKISGITDQDIEEMLDAIDESMEITKLCSESNFDTGSTLSKKLQDVPNSFIDSHRDLCNYLKSEGPEIFKNRKISLNLKAQVECFKKLRNIFESTEDMPIDEKRYHAHEVLEELKELMLDADEETSESDNGDSDEATTYLGKVDRMREMSDSDDSDDIQEAIYLVEKMALEKKGEKGVYASTGNTQETELSQQNEELQYDDESLMKFIDRNDEIKGKEKDGSEMKQEKEMLSLCPSHFNPTDSSFQEMEPDLKKRSKFPHSKSDAGVDKFINLKSAPNNLKGTLEHHLSEKELSEKNAKELEEIKASKEQTDKLNDLIMEFRKSMGFKEERNDDDNTNETGQNTLQNATDGKKDFERCDDRVNDFHSDKKLKENMSTGKTKTACAQGRISPVNDFQQDFKKFMKLQTSKFEEQVKKHKAEESHLMGMKEENNYFSSEKGPVTGVTETEYHEETRVLTNHEDEEIETIATSDDEPSEMLIELRKSADIHFEIDTQGNKHIFVDGQYYFYSSKEKQGFKLNYREEEIQVSFTGNNIFVSTQNSEFDIFVRKLTQIDLTDESTQTDTSP